MPVVGQAGKTHAKINAKHDEKTRSKIQRKKKKKEKGFGVCAEYTNVQINTPLSMLLLCLQFSMTSLLWHTIIFGCCERPVFSHWIHVQRCFCETIRSTVYETGGSGAVRGAWPTKLGGRDGSVSVNHPCLFLDRKPAFGFSSTWHTAPHVSNGRSFWCKVSFMTRVGLGWS